MPVLINWSLVFFVSWSGRPTNATLCKKTLLYKFGIALRHLYIVASAFEGARYIKDVLKASLVLVWDLRGSHSASRAQPSLALAIGYDVIRQLVPGKLI